MVKAEHIGMGFLVLGALSLLAHRSKTTPPEGTPPTARQVLNSPTGKQALTNVASVYGQSFADSAENIIGTAANVEDALNQIRALPMTGQKTIARDLTGAVNLSTGDITPGAVGLGAFDAVIAEARKRHQSGIKRSRWISDIKKNISYVGTSVRQGALNRLQNGEITNAEYQKIRAEVNAAEQRARNEVNSYR